MVLTVLAYFRSFYWIWIYLRHHWFFSIVDYKVMGDGFDKEVNQGPLINDQQLHKVQGLIDDAVGKGARLMTGGCIHPTLGGRFFSPTVISGVNSSMNIYHEEIFGPVIPLHTFSNEEEVEFGVDFLLLLYYDLDYFGLSQI